ncbi:MAG: NAD(P)-dependent dehydrogenase (short-subunit alcohol dehydrogenase family) [Myxococcota bacterium]|jgi:NAD(P)-dependent dehydrogenase (short-subunit alcohol dehydrogenase family)
MGSLDGKTALVTGASRGIGEAIARQFATEGAQLVLVSRKREGLEASAKRILDATGVECRIAPCNTGDLANIGALFAELDDADVRVDVLVNNAATNPYFGPMIPLEFSAWDKTFDVNLKGSFEFARQVAVRCMEDKRPASIINLSSVYGMTGAPFQGIYAMTKAALISLTKTLAQEWGPSNIRVNALAPGLVDTQFAAAIVHNPALSKIFTERSALKRHAVADEIAGIATFLASDAASFITGATLPVDGGYLAG